MVNVPKARRLRSLSPQPCPAVASQHCCATPKGHARYWYDASGHQSRCKWSQSGVDRHLRWLFHPISIHFISFPWMSRAFQATPSHSKAHLAVCNREGDSLKALQLQLTLRLLAHQALGQRVGHLAYAIAALRRIRLRLAAREPPRHRLVAVHLEPHEHRARPEHQQRHAARGLAKQRPQLAEEGASCAKARRVER